MCYPTAYVVGKASKLGDMNSNVPLSRGAWVAQSVERLTSAQIMILQFVSSSPASGSVLTARSVEPASDSVSPPLSDSFNLFSCPFRASHMLYSSSRWYIHKFLCTKSISDQIGRAHV